MKKKIIIGISALFAVVICVIFTINGNKIMYSASEEPIKTTNSEVTLVAHRGFSSVAPENTLAAIEEAAKASFYGTEFDIRLTADGEWVVMHNDSLKDMTASEGLVSQMTADELTKLTIDGGNGTENYPNEKIPTLAQTLEKCKEVNINPVIEIKLNDDQKPDYEYLAQLIKSAKCDNLLIISFSGDALVQLKKYLPEAEYWFLTNKVTDDNITFCTENNLDGINFDGRKSKNHKYIDKIKEADLTAASWTIDNLKLMEKLHDMGVNYITTNVIYP